MAYHIVSLGRLTRRAADGGYAPRFLGLFLALGFFRFDGESILLLQLMAAGQFVYDILLGD